MSVHSLAAMEALHMTSRQMTLLMAIVEKPGLSNADYATTTDVAAVKVGAVTDALEARGMVTKARSTKDKRLVVITPTAEGKRAAATIRKALAS